MTERTEHHHGQWTIGTGLAASIALASWLCGCGAPGAQLAQPETAPPPQPAPAPAPVPAADPAAQRPASAPPASPGSTVEAVAAELSYSKTLAGVSTMQDALGKVKSALAEQGFGIITEIDVQKVMKKKLGTEMKPFWILGACNPKKAHQAIEVDPQMGLLLPCKVIVYQDPADGFVVAFARPKTIFGLVDRPGLSSLAEDVETEIRAAFDAL